MSKQQAEHRRHGRRLLFEGLETRRMLAFGVTTGVAPTGQSTYVVDNGADLKFSVIRGGNTTSTLHLADLSSIQYKGQELLATYAETSRYSHYEQGLSSQTSISYSIGANDEWILVTCDDSNFGVVQYYAVRNGDNNLYMASDVSAGGEGRLIAYLSRDVFTNIEEPSSLDGVIGTVEGSDVFFKADGETRSKFYNTRRMIENEYHGVTGSAGSIDVGAWMFMGNREHSAGGPFFKDIDFQTTGGATEIYNVLFSGHTQTEPYRYGLLGPYSLQITDGSLPQEPDYSWMEDIGIQGWIPSSARGSISGVANGMAPGHQTVVGLSNAAAQYWAIADATTGEFSISDVQAGTYTMTMYDQELEVGTRTVTIEAQANLLVDIANTYYTPAGTWRIGTWDGTPAGFLNSDKIATMHPSDVRMSPWVDTNYVVGVNTEADWPMAQFVGVNNGQRITFNLSAAQAATAQTLRIGITLGFEGGRNRITVNAGQSDAWTSGIPAASRDLNSRGITRGTYRGDNQLYTYNIPVSALHAGTNTLDLPVVSGSSGSGFLSPNVVYDAIDLVPTASITNAPRLESITLTPASSSVGLGAEIDFTALAKDQFGDPITANIDFSTTGGFIDQQGHFTAQLSSGFNTITASSGGVSAEATVVVLGSAPVVVTPASASPTISSGAPIDLSVLGDDDGGESSLTYTWSVLGTPPGTVSFSANGTNAAKNTTVTLNASGDYDLLVTLEDNNGNTATSQVTVSSREYVARYKADETGGTTLADSSGGNNTASLSGSYGFDVGRSNNALNLSGGFATLPTGIVSALDDFTIATWVKPSSLSTWARIFDFGDDTTNYMFLTTQSNTGMPRFAIRTPTIEQQNLDSSVPIATDVWTHVAITLSGTTARLYINGVQRGFNAGLTLNPSSLGETANNFLGKSQWPDPAYEGLIDDFRIYPSALASRQISALANTVLPSAPTNLVATASGSNQIDLTWPSVSGATSYSVYRAASSGGPFTQVASTSDLTYQDHGLTVDPANGTTYYYSVAAENAGGDGPMSALASAMALPPLPSPTEVVAEVAQQGSLELSWTAVEDAASYTIERSSSSGGTYSPIVSGLTTTSYTDTGLTDHLPYYYLVRSVNLSGSVASAEAVGVPTDLQVRLRLDETSGTTASDSSGHGNDAALNNGPTWSSAGKLAGTLVLDGSNDFASLPSGVVSSLTEVTIATWVKLTSAGQWARIFDFGTGANVNMFLTPRNGANDFLRFAITTNGNGAEQQINTTQTFPLGVWAHVAVTLNGSAGVLYVDGVEVGRNNALTLTPSSLGITTNNYLGRSQYPDPYLDGQLDDFRIYSRALNAVEVAGLTYVPVNPGDYDLDGEVTGSDFLSWQRQLETAASPFGSSADGDVNGRVDAPDLAVWREYYGTASTFLAASADTLESPSFIALGETNSLVANAESGDSLLEATDEALAMLDEAGWLATRPEFAPNTTGASSLRRADSETRMFHAELSSLHHALPPQSNADAKVEPQAIKAAADQQSPGREPESTKTGRLDRVISNELDQLFV